MLRESRISTGKKALLVDCLSCLRYILWLPGASLDAQHEVPRFTYSDHSSFGGRGGADMLWMATLEKRVVGTPWTQVISCSNQ